MAYYTLEVFNLSFNTQLSMVNSQFANSRFTNSHFANFDLVNFHLVYDTTVTYPFCQFANAQFDYLNLLISVSTNLLIPTLANIHNNK